MCVWGGSLSLPFHVSSTFAQHTAAVCGLVFTKDGSRLATLGEDGWLFVYHCHDKVEADTMSNMLLR